MQNYQQQQQPTYQPQQPQPQYPQAPQPQQPGLLQQVQGWLERWMQRMGQRQQAQWQAYQASGQQVTRTYHSQHHMTQDMQHMARQGYRVVSTMAHDPRSGIGRTLALGVVGAAVFHPKTRFTVVYARG